MKPSIGGVQFWSDVCLRLGFRLQKKAGHDLYRLLDKNFLIIKKGTFADCLSYLNQVSPPPATHPDTAVVLLHGLIRTHWSMIPLEKEVHVKTKWATYNLEYASTRLSVSEHAENLQTFLSLLPPYKKIHFITHSLGGVILRAVLKLAPLPNIGRVVFIGTPQYGAERADWWSQFRIYSFIIGPSGEDLKTDSELQKNLHSMEGIEFGIIAGGRGKNFYQTQTPGFSPLLKGDNDGTVTVESTLLPGAKDYVIVPRVHAILVYSRRVKKMTIAFLLSGKFKI